MTPRLLCVSIVLAVAGQSLAWAVAVSLATPVGAVAGFPVA
ncbi:hypothetical protein [Acuticoccus sediminis]|nr:hypothetical protein [Acuticoccus sediminis]